MLPRSQNSTIPATILLLLSPLAIPSGPFSCHAFCPSLLQHIVTLKRHKELPWRLTKRHARESGPQSYIYIMQVIRSLFFSGSVMCVFRLPITGIMHFGLRQIAALRRAHFRRDLMNSTTTVRLSVTSK
jgi:hypothetical protein